MHDLFVRGMSRVAVVLDIWYKEVVYGLLQKDTAPTGRIINQVSLHTEIKIF